METPVDSATKSRRPWRDSKWQGNDGVKSERRHLALLSVLGGLVFFGAGCWGASSVTNRNTQSLNAPYGGYTQGPGDVPSPSINLADVASLELKVRSYNSYTKDKAVTLYPWEHLAEPHKPNVLELLNWPASGDELDYR